MKLGQLIRKCGTRLTRLTAGCIVQFQRLVGKTGLVTKVLEMMGIKMRLLSSTAKRKAAFIGHICRGLRVTDVLTTLEGRVDGIRSPGAQTRK